MSTPAVAAPPDAPPAQVDWTRLLLGFGGMVIGQFMAILDIQIVAASLPQIQAGVGASADEISWVQTAYLIPEVVMIPLSGFLSRMWGTRALFIASCIGFLIMSVATGFAGNIQTMIVFRALQGFLGGAMIPTVFAVAFTAFPRERQVTASVIMGLIVTLAPTVGPTLGGHLSEWLSWRWLFFVNVFPGLIVLVLVWRYGDFDKGDPGLARHFDWPALGLMAVALMSMQYVLEEGAKEDWFADPLIASLSVVCVITGALFVWRSLKSPQPLVELRALSNRNFLSGVVMTFIVGAALFGGTFLLPLFLGRVRDFSSAEVGTTMMVSGASMFLTGPIAGRIVRKLDLRVVMGFGFALCTWGMWMAAKVTPEWGFWQFAGVQAARGVGVMLAMIAAQQVTMSTLRRDMVKNASGLVNLSRNVGGAVGLAILNTTINRQSDRHLEELQGALTAGSAQAQTVLSGFAARLEAMGVARPDLAAQATLARLLEQQAATRTFADAFVVLAIACLVGMAAALLASPVRGGGGASEASGVH